MRTLTIVASLGLAAIAGAAACSSGGSTTAPPPAQATCDPCDDAAYNPTTPLSGHDTNPDGFPYPNPAGGYGHNVRTGPKSPGSVMQNFKFLGYPNADRSKGIQTVALADYYDPCSRRYKLIHLSVAAVWCGPCNQETSDLVAAKAQLDAEQVVLVQALDDGPSHAVPATVTDLNNWVIDHGSNFTEMLDPGLQNLGGFFLAQAVPFNADIDPRDMELIDTGDGYAGTVAAEIDLTVLPATPGYDFGVKCN